MAIHITFLVFYILLFGFVSGTELYFALCLHMILYIINSLRKKEAISPITLFALGVVLVSIGNVSLLDELHKGTITTYSYIIPSGVDEGVLIWCISCTIIIMGYTLAVKKSLPPINFDIKKHHPKVIYIVLVLLNVALIFDDTLNIRRTIPLIGIFNTFAILFFARLWASENNKTYAKYTIILLVLETYNALASSFLRSEVIYPLLSLFIGYFLGKKDMKFLFSYRIIPFAIIVVFYVSVFSALETRRSNFLTFFTEKNKTNPYAKVDKNARENKKDALLIRSANIAQISNVVNLVKQNGFYGGRASAPLVLALIPRVLWPNKPKIQLGAWFALEIGQASLTIYGTANNSINMTVMGEMYLDFGWIGVVVGSLLLGMIIATLWNSTHFYESNYNLSGTLFGGYLLLIMLIGIAADLQIVITFMSFYITFSLLKVLAKNMYLGGKQ